MRVACLLVPDLPLHAELRASPELVGQPLVITSGPGTRAEILRRRPDGEYAADRTFRTDPAKIAEAPEIERPGCVGESYFVGCRFARSE